TLWPVPYNTSTGYTRGQPIDVLILPGSILIRPLPDGIYTINATANYTVPASLDLISVNPDDDTWGPVIAYGAAMSLHMSKGEKSLAADLAPEYQDFKRVMNRKAIRFMESQRAIPIW